MTQYLFYLNLENLNNYLSNLLIYKLFIYSLISLFIGIYFSSKKTLIDLGGKVATAVVTGVAAGSTKSLVDNYLADNTDDNKNDDNKNKSKNKDNSKNKSDTSNNTNNDNN